MKELAFAAMLLAGTALAGHATTYTETIPAMGPALLPVNNGGVVRSQVVDATGPVDFVFKEFGQNWECLGTDNNPNNSDNYPVVGIYDIGPQPLGFHGRSLTLGSAPLLAQVIVGHPDDYPSCTAEGGVCNSLFTLLKPTTGMSVTAGDVLVWVATRIGVNCPGQAHVLGDPEGYPSAPGGEVALGIHVHD